MTDESRAGPGDDDPPRSLPIDFDRLDVIGERLRGDERVDRISWEPDRPANELVCRLDSGRYPPSIRSARLEIVWYENDDFSVHYHEAHPEGSFDHRWDRHPSEHNAREHVHPGPDAPTPGDDASYPADWRDVLAMIVREIDDRQRGFWTAGDP